MNAIGFGCKVITSQDVKKTIKTQIRLPWSQVVTEASKHFNPDQGKSQYNTIQYSLFNEGDEINPKSYLTYGLHNGTK